MNKKLIILIGVCLLLVVGCGEKKNKEIAPGKVTCEQMKEVLKDNDSRLIDVRTAEEYAEGHLDGAINIPYEEIVDKLAMDRGINPIETKIVVYCRSGKRSGTAYDSLVKAGYKKVYDLGAMNNCK